MENSYKELLIREFESYYGREKATEIICAILDRVIEWKCREKFKRENKQREFECKNIAQTEWSSDLKIQNQVSAEVDKEADEYFNSMLQQYRKPFMNNEQLTF